MESNANGTLHIKQNNKWEIEYLVSVYPMSICIVKASLSLECVSTATTNHNKIEEVCSQCLFFLCFHFCVDVVSQL